MDIIRDLNPININFSPYKDLSIDGINLIKLYLTNYKNLVHTSINSDGTIFNTKGYQNGYRLNSSGTTTPQNLTITTGFIPCKASDIIRIAGVDLYAANAGYSYLSFYDSSFNLLGSQSNSKNDSYPDGQTLYRGNVVSNGLHNSSSNKNGPSINAMGVVTFDNYTFSTNANSVAYFRVNGYGDGRNMIVTINQEIDNLNFFKPIWEKYFYHNQVISSINSNGTIYNDIGYKNGYRVRSGGAEAESSNTTCTGFIPVRGGDVIRIAGGTFNFAANGNAINLSDNSFTNIGQFTMIEANYGILADNGAYKAYGSSSVVREKPNVWKWIVPPEAAGVKYIRVSMQNSNEAIDVYPDRDLIVTVNEEISIIG